MSAPAALLAADIAGLRLARTVGHSPGAERAVKAYSALGEHGLVWLALGVVGAALDAPRRARWQRGAGTVAGAYCANQVVKLAVRRRRPQLPDLPPLIQTPTQLSFPSAHATASLAAARAYSGLLPAALLFPAAGAMALSRLYLGVHYPSDVAAGGLLGLLLGGLAR